MFEKVLTLLNFPTFSLSEYVAVDDVSTVPIPTDKDILDFIDYPNDSTM